jgi:hypothetical protein
MDDDGVLTPRVGDVRESDLRLSLIDERMQAMAIGNQRVSTSKICQGSGGNGNVLSKRLNSARQQQNTQIN